MTLKWLSVFALPAFLQALSPQSARADSAKPDQPCPNLDKAWMAKHQYIVSLVRRASRQESLEVYFLGDSITEFWPAIGKPVWQREFGKMRVLNCGVSGDTTQNILYRITHGEFDGIRPKVVVLLAGINNLANSEDLSPKELAKGHQKIIETLQRKSPSSKMVLVSIFPSGNPADPIRKRIQATNACLAKIADDRSVTYLDLYRSFLKPDGSFPRDISPDGTHLSNKGYEIWATGLRPVVQKLLN